MKLKNRYDVVILGAGQAGLSLARQLILYSDRSILHLEKRKNPKTQKQKVGESTVQIGGYYFSKILDLEEYLLQNHLMKYNLRFLWKSEMNTPNHYENYSQSFIRNFSNIASYQLDRNKFESKLINVNSESKNYDLLTGIGIQNIIIKKRNHKIDFRWNNQLRSVQCDWIVDASGRNQYLSRKLNLKKSCPIKHNAHHFWVDGLVNIEKMTEKSIIERRQLKTKTVLGHIPVLLATNHFMGEGFWFWVIPLKTMTSFGLVYDPKRIEPTLVNRQEKLLKWIFSEFPLFGDSLKDKKIIDFTTINNFAYDCKKTLSTEGWAITGVSGRFNDPLYSPGADTIAIQNSAITELINTKLNSEMEKKISYYEPLFQVLFHSFLPTYYSSYDALGDSETFALKYTWELSVYFSFYVFPFTNDLFLNPDFLDRYFQRIATLGPINRTLQKYINDYYHWKMEKSKCSKQVFFDFMDVYTLKECEKTFYEVSSDIENGIRILDEKLSILKQFARLIIAHIKSRVHTNPQWMIQHSFVQSIKLKKEVFDPSETIHVAKSKKYDWGKLDPYIFSKTFD